MSPQSNQCIQIITEVLTLFNNHIAGLYMMPFKLTFIQLALLNQLTPLILNKKTLTCCLLLLAISPQMFAQTQQATTPPVTQPAKVEVPVVLPTSADILTPPALPQPLIHGPKIFGVRPGSPFLYTIPATGTRPMKFSADKLPSGLHLNGDNGQISGSIAKPGSYQVTFHAKNSLGNASRQFKIVVGETIALTPPMGWNSWNCWHADVDQTKIMRSAEGFIKYGLDQHGWTYINIDDAWQGKRGGPLNAIQPDSVRFPDMKGLSDAIHKMGLKLGIYSTPWTQSYARHVGGSSENADGSWDPKTSGKGGRNKKELPYAIGKYSFAKQDAQQWAIWAIDYLKYDWAPNELPETKEMYNALRAAKRDVILSLSNNSTESLLKQIPEISKYANCWRTGHDINDSWSSVKAHGFGQGDWLPYSSRGHWNDPDMFEVGANGGGKPKRLTANEQYTHISLWCLLNAPLLLGCDLEHMDDFTLNLLTNDEVIDVNQDELGKQAVDVASDANTDVYAKPMIDGSWSVGLFNRGNADADVTIKWADIKLSGKCNVRDLWRQKDLGSFADAFTTKVGTHGVVLIKVGK
jgi:alpha-galactosidase